MQTFESWRNRKANLEQEVLAFFKENPNPDDDKLHDWAEEKGYNVHEVETEIYRLLTKFSQGEKKVTQVNKEGE